MCFSMCENVCICFYVLHWTQSYWILLLNFNNNWLSRYLQFSLDLLAVRRSPIWLKNLSQAADAGMAVFTLRDNFLTCGKECKEVIFVRLAAVRKGIIFHVVLQLSFNVVLCQDRFNYFIKLFIPACSYIFNSFLQIASSDFTYNQFRKLTANKTQTKRKQISSQGQTELTHIEVLPAVKMLCSVVQEFFFEWGSSNAADPLFLHSIRSVYTFNLFGWILWWNNSCN